MSTSLSDTSASEINKALSDVRRAHGGPTAGHVMTLIMITDGHGNGPEVQSTCRTAGEHPSRILVVRRHPNETCVGLDAEVFGAGERGPGELVILDLSGELAWHAESVVVPLLIPDTPVVTFWPGNGPDDPSADPLGRLSQRRITDLAAGDDAPGRLAARAAHYTDGDTDLAWTRLTLWRSVLATALDDVYSHPTGGVVAAEPGNASAELLAMWLSARLGIPVQREESTGPGLTEVRLSLPDGEVTLRRTDGRLAMLSSPGHHERPIALKRRDLSELINEELRRLDADDIYAECLATIRETETREGAQ
ncbi:MAG TPA: glucose-6-phosphate dehydrogenase assembly protein OpcA [Sporichthyaceae bacterium]|nr:glucose-6-phosphate dehydrogenase assembly protein OpcA [Sporichthyaceae bacterium]